MTTTTILSGGKTRELFAQLDKKNPTHAAHTDCNYAKVSLALRYCWIREYHGWTKGFAQSVKFVPTGGMLLKWYIDGIPEGYSKLSSGEVRIKSDTTERQQKAVSRAITRIIRMAVNERIRIAAVMSLDTICSPFESDDEFANFVETWEKKDDKQSDYQTLTTEDCEVWKARVAKYAQDKASESMHVEPMHEVEGTLANFDRYIAGDR